MVKDVLNLKRILLMLITILLAFSCFACETDTPERKDKEDDSSTIDFSTENNYNDALKAIDEGDFQTAYDLLLEDKDNEASKLLLEKFVFIPDEKSSTEINWEISNNLFTLKEHLNYAYSLDNNGKITSKVVTDDRDENWGYTVNYRYDDKGRIIQKNHTPFESWRTPESNTYTYNDTESKYTHRHVGSGDGLGNYTDTYFYDTKGNLTHRDTVCDNGLTGKTTFTYDDNGQLIKMEYVGSDKYSFVRTIDYNEYGNIIKIYTSWSDGSASEIKFYWRLCYYPDINLKNAIKDYMDIYLFE